ncbi:unnamed protein product [Coregonus sp. 'balchen']|nr:unnamed protein product [Coregonus sp. 'balchen']
MPSWIRLTLLLSALPVHCFLDGTCPRRGSALVLGCSGQVEVNGLEVTVNRAEHTSSSYTTTTGNGKYTSAITGVHTTTVSTTTDTSANGTTVSAIKDSSDKGKYTVSTGKDIIVLTVTDTPDDTRTDSMEKTVIRNTRAGDHTPLTVREVNNGNGKNVENVTEEEYKGGGEQRDTGLSLYTVNQPGHTATQKQVPSTGASLQPTRDSGVGGADTELPSDRWTDAMDGEDDYEEEEDGGRKVRGLRGRSQWRLNGRLLRGGEERGGVVVLGRRGATLTLSSLAVGDSGNYSCHRGGKLVSSLRVSVAVPPERPKLSCYKRSPSSKIRCDWTASQPVTPVPQCYLLLRKGAKEEFDGHWSVWSTPVYANTWTAPVPTALSDLSTVMQDYTDYTDSGSVSESQGDVEEVWPHVLWVVVSCVLLSITLLSAYLYRHREKFMSKLWRLRPISSSPSGPSPPVTAPPTQEGHALVNFDHPIYGEPVPQEEERKEEDEEEEEEEKEEEKEEVIRFNNTSYFLVQSN